MNKPIDLDEYKNKDNLEFTRTQKLLIHDVLDHYRRVYDILSRQIGNKDYKDNFEENKTGEEWIIKLLDPEQKDDLEVIVKKLGDMIQSVEKIIK